jgi:hypothetical protein
MVAEGNWFVVYMYENVVQSSLNLGSEQKFYFISPYHEDQVYFINYYNINIVPCLDTDHLWKPNVACYVTEDAVLIGNRFYDNLH